jgi:hypothetical protein
MPEITIKYKSAKALKALQNLTKLFDITIEGPVGKVASKDEEKAATLPITFAKHPDVKALAGIWQGKNITLEELRKDAWGDRV